MSYSDEINERLKQMNKQLQLLEEAYYDFHTMIAEMRNRKKGGSVMIHRGFLGAYTGNEKQD